MNTVFHVECDDTENNNKNVKLQIVNKSYLSRYDTGRKQFSTITLHVLTQAVYAVDKAVVS